MRNQAQDLVAGGRKPGKTAASGSYACHPGGVSAVMADPSVTFMAEGIDAAVVAALVSRDGGEVATALVKGGVHGVASSSTASAATSRWNRFMPRPGSTNDTSTGSNRSRSSRAWRAA